MYPTTHDTCAGGCLMCYHQQHLLQAKDMPSMVCGNVVVTDDDAVCVTVIQMYEVSTLEG